MADILEDEATVDSNDWLKTLFGNEEQVGVVPTSIDLATSAINSWLGYQQLGVAKDQVSLQKQAFEQNTAQSNMEASLKLDAMQRGLAHHGVQSDTVDKYATEYSNK